MSEAFDPYRKWLGIPPHEQPPNQYRLLGIAVFEDDPDVIENAANRQMAHVRTFQAGRHGALSQRLLNELSAARVCLLDPEKKQVYDQQLRHELAAAQAPRPVAGGEAAPAGLPGAPAAPVVGNPPGSLPAALPSVGGTPAAVPTAAPPTAVPGVGVAVPQGRGGVGAARGGSAVVTTRSRSVAASRKLRRRSSPVPLIVALIGGTIAIGGLVVVLNGGLGDISGGGASQVDPPNRGSGLLRDSGRGPAQRLKPVDRTDRPGRAGSGRNWPGGGSGLPAGGDSGRDASSGFSRVDSGRDATSGFSRLDSGRDATSGFSGADAAIPGLAGPGDSPTTPALPGMSVREQIFAEAVEAARDGLAERKLAAVSGALDRASSAQLDDRQLAVLNRLQAIKTYVTNFWDGVRRGIRESLKEERSIEYAGKTYRVVSYEEDTVKFSVAEEPLEAKVAELPIEHALAFCSVGLSAEDPFTKVYVAAVLVTDHQTRGDARRVDEARRLLRESAEAAGSPDVNPYVAEELGDAGQPQAGRSEPLPEDAGPPGSTVEGAPAETGDPVVGAGAGAEDARTAVPAEEELTDARGQLQEQYKGDYDQVRRDREHRGPLAQKLLDDSRMQADPTLRYAMLREACEQAIKACDAPILRAAVDELAAVFAVEPLACRFEYWEQYARQRDADGQTVMDAAAELRELALGQDKLELAIELLDLGMRGAKKEQDEDAFRELNVQQQQLKSRLNDRKREGF